jgi:hypothetical protein
MLGDGSHGMRCPAACSTVRTLLGKMTLQADILKEAKISPFSSSAQ